MATNNFLQFAPTDTGTNLLSQADYSVAADRTIGNQPGVASSKLVNKAIRQSAYITSQVAQMVSDKLNADVLDDATPAKLLAQLNAALLPLQPVVTTYLTAGSFTHNLTYRFFIVAGNATAAATYTNNGVTYTVKKTIAGGTILEATGNNVPTTSGTLTKASGTGDATLTFYAYRSAVYLRGRLVGGGGGGSGGGQSQNAGTAGGTSSFGTTLLTAIGGAAPVSGGTTTALGTGASGVNVPGGNGTGSGLGIAATTAAFAGGAGGNSALGGGGGGGNASGAGNAGGANTGGGGGGGGTDTSGSVNFRGGSGGGAGAFVDAVITGTLAVTYAVVVGAGGGGGSAGSVGYNGGAGGSGMVEVTEYFQ